MNASELDPVSSTGSGVAPASRPSPSRGRSMTVLAAFVVTCGLVAFFGGQFTPGEWYGALEKPPWNPPSWVFGPVWTILYLMIAVSGWLVWRQAGWRPARGPLVVYAVQLALNGAWSWLFFGLHRPGLAFAEILLLWLSIVLLVVLFSRIRLLAGLLLVPYLAWVTFAALLNYSLWRLNL